VAAARCISLRGGNFEIDLENGKEGGHFVGARLPTSSPSPACQISRIRARGGVGSAVYQVNVSRGRSAAGRGPAGPHSGVASARSQAASYAPLEAAAGRRGGRDVAPSAPDPPSPTGAAPCANATPGVAHT
jgi:hypothetical protein